VGALAIPSSFGKDGRRWLKRGSQQTAKTDAQTDRRLTSTLLRSRSDLSIPLRLGSESACLDPSQLSARPSEQPRDLARGAWNACRRNYGGMLPPAEPDGRPCDRWVSDHNLAPPPRLRASPQRRPAGSAATSRSAGWRGSFHHPDARTIWPRWAGEPFDLHACVQTLFTIKLPLADRGS
jgi:hypothetical protein